jgi:DNA end-binding protein Ku
MARSLWSGSLSFGLVNVPVNLLTALRDLDLHFHQLHEKDGARIEVQRWCSKEDVEVPFEDIAHSYELDDGTQVVLSDEDLESVAPRRTRTIEIEQFVDLDDVDPILFDHPYFLVPARDDDGATRAYQLLVEVMAQTDRAALGRFVMRAKEYLAIVRSRDGVLTLTTMRFADEVRATDELDTGSAKSHRPTRQQLERAVAVIEELSTDWNPAEHKDRYQARLRRVVERKRKGETIKAPAAEKPPEEAPDLMAALEATLEQMRGGGGQTAKRRQRQEA